MRRYDQGSDAERDYEPGSGGQVLRNKLGLTDLHLVDSTEAALLALAQSRSFDEIGTETQFSVAVVRDLHRDWLGELYDFAGEIRAVDLSKNTVRFAPVAYMESSLQQLDRVLAEHTPCAEMTLERVVTAIARVHTELVLVHPFRERNGRLARWIADLMALQAGYPPLEWRFDWAPEERRDRYFAALRRGFAMNFTPLETLVHEAIETAVRSAEDPERES